jgi:hypothetical protein
MKRFVRMPHLRALLAAAMDAPWFASRVPWQTVETLQTWGLLEHGAVKMTSHGRSVLEEFWVDRLIEPRLVALLDELQLAMRS